MTEAEMHEIAARANAATPGPWDGVSQSVVGYNIHIVGARDVGEVMFAGNSAADVDFIAHAITDIPALCAEVARYRSVLKQIAGMGRVCEMFEICNHPACHDSSAACIMALNALYEGEKE